MKRLLWIMVLCLALTFAACGQDDGGGEMQVPGDALSQLRGEMKPPVIAVANFGFPELAEESEIMEYLMEEYPSWLSRMDFIGQIPSERIVQGCPWGGIGNLLCVVPQDPNATVTVNIIHYTEDYSQSVESILYKSETGEPILVYADASDGVSTSVTVVNSDGRGVIWEPYWDNYQSIPEDAYTGHLVMDFTPVSEKTGYQLALDQGWYVPELSELDGGFWLSDYYYGLDLLPDDVPDNNGGWAKIYDVDQDGMFTDSYTGSWSYEDGLLYLSLVPVDNGVQIDDSFPVLLDPWSGEWLWIGRSESGQGLPHFPDYIDNDELSCPKG